MGTFYFSLFTFALLLFWFFVGDVNGGEDDEDGKGTHSQHQIDIATWPMHNFEQEAKVNQRKNTCA